MDVEWSALLEDLIIRYRQGDLSACIDAETFANSASENFKSIAYTYLAQFALLNNDFAKAEVSVENAYSSFSPHSEYVDENVLALSKILLYFYRGQLTKSLEILTQEQFRDHHQFQYWTGECLYWLGNFGKAYMHYGWSSRFSANNDLLAEDYRLAKLGQARCLTQMEKIGQACKILENIYPNSRLPENLGNETAILVPSELARVYAMQNKFYNAYKILQTNLDTSQITHPYYRANIFMTCGLVHFRSKEYDVARENFSYVVHSNIRKWEKLEAYTYLAKLDEQENYSQRVKLWHEELLQFPETFLTKNAIQNTNSVTTQDSNGNTDHDATPTSNVIKHNIPENSTPHLEPASSSGNNHPIFDSIPLECLIQAIFSLRKNKP